MHLRPVLFLVFSCVFSWAALGQNATVRGFVYDKESGEPVIFTNVFLDGTQYGVATDVNGYFSISRVPAGDYTLKITSVGYEAFSESITLESGKILNRTYRLNKSSIDLEEFEISAEKQEAQNKVQMSVTKITPKEIKSLPSVGGEPDLAQYVQVLPGVVFTGDQGGQLYIRGGSPIQNKVLLDGMVIYSPFHSIGLFSVFDTDIIRNADIYTGGFPAMYGGRISSVMDIRTIDGNISKAEGKINVSPFGAKALLSGPLKKATAEKPNTSSYLISAKTSYLRETSKTLYSYVDEDGLPFNFTDLYGKLTFSSGRGSKVSLFGFNFTDEVNYFNVSKLKWSNFGLGSNFVLVPSGSAVLIEGHVAFSDYGISLKEDNVNQLRESGISGFELGMDFKYFSGNNELKYGIQINGFSTDFLFFNASGQNFDLSDNTTNIAGYFDYKIKAGSFVIQPSFRAQYYASLAEFSPEPRLGIKFNVNEFLRLKAAGGLYSQNLIAGNSDRDVVNLFYGFISSPDNIPKSYTDEEGNRQDVNSALQRASHAIAGFEYDLTSRVNLNVEAYYKRFNQLTNVNRNKIFADTPENAERPDEFKKDFVVETGDARGVDVTIKYTTPRLYVWAVYSLGDVDRWDGTQLYDPIFDRRHNVNLLASYTAGKEGEWEFNARWNFGSGLPFTQNAGFLEEMPFNEGVNTDVTSENGNFSFRLADLNGGRLSDYHRLDMNITRHFFFPKSELKAVLGVTNIYNRDNIFFINRVTFDRVDQLPILPSFGLTYSF